MEKALFLDIDGVLNSMKSAREHKSFQILNPIALQWIKHLFDNGVEIVVSSSWRRSNSKESLTKILGVEIRHITPTVKTIENTFNNAQRFFDTRGEEIQAWLDIHKPKKFAIIDDDSDMLDTQKPFFVKTNMEEGMVFENMVELCKLLDIVPPSFK